VAWHAACNLFVLKMSDPIEAMHAIRNDLSPILFFAQMASTGDGDAQRLVIERLVERTEAIRAELDVLDAAVQAARRQS
jgi:hypothetical protein